MIPVYSVPQHGNSSGSGSGGPVSSGPGGPVISGPGGLPGNGIISCAGLRELAVLGQCAPGRTAVQVPAQNLFDDNPQYSTQPIASASSPAASASASGLYLQDVLVKVNSPATLEKVRTYLVTHATQSASGTAPRTFGEAVQAREGVAATVQRLIYIAVLLTLIVAGCSLAVAVGGSLIERKRPFTLLRLTGTPTSTLYRVVFLEAVLPLVAATIVAAGIAYGIAVLTVRTMAPAGRSRAGARPRLLRHHGRGADRLAAGDPRLAAAARAHHRARQRPFRIADHWPAACPYPRAPSPARPLCSSIQDAGSGGRLSAASLGRHEGPGTTLGRKRPAPVRRQRARCPAGPCQGHTP